MRQCCSAQPEADESHTLIDMNEATVPVACAGCGSDRIKGPDQPGAGLSYWRCLKCGIVWNPVSAFEAAVDFYRIKIEDRVVLSGNFNQARVADLLRPFGANSGRFFTNSIDTVTKGVEAEQ